MQTQSELNDRLVQLTSLLGSVTQELEQIRTSLQKPQIDTSTIPVQETTPSAPQSNSKLERQKSEIDAFLSEGIVLEQASSEDEFSLTRPSLYPHKPTPRLDALEKSRFKFEMNSLKLDKFEGFYNLAFLLLSTALLFMAARNIREKGILLDLNDFTCPEMLRDLHYVVYLMAFMFACSTSVYWILKSFILGLLSWRACVIAYVFSQGLLITVPTSFLYLSDISPVPSMIVMLFASVFMLKMHSYIATNYAMFAERVVRYGPLQARLNKNVAHTFLELVFRAPAGSLIPVTSTSSDEAAEPEPQEEKDEQDGAPSLVPSPSNTGGLRKRKSFSKKKIDTSSASSSSSPSSSSPPGSHPHIGGRRGSTDIISGTSVQKQNFIKLWPHNVTFPNFVHFLFIPCLVYEPKYPRTRSIRITYVLRKLFEFLLSNVLMYCVMKQFILPILSESAVPPSADLIDRFLLNSFHLMRLAIPSFFIWLTLFYGLFHCLLNIVAELTFFGDRYFFGSWYNATRLDHFWKLWNIPVHEFCLRHVYLELKHYVGVNNHLSMFATFFVSAIFHELIFSAAFKTFRPFFFFGMLFQIPMIMISRIFSDKRRGNTLVWLSLFLGQPLLEILYLTEFLQRYDNFFCMA
jgi:MBOAT, membrane-bound O-acyltransferase family